MKNWNNLDDDDDGDWNDPNEEEQDNALIYFFVYRISNVGDIMKKVHTKIKRKYGLGTHTNRYDFFHPKKKENRPKTFKTEEAAKAWAKDHGLKPEQYSLKKVKRNKKFQIVQEIKAKKQHNKKSC